MMELPIGWFPLTGLFSHNAVFVLEKAFKNCHKLGILKEHCMIVFAQRTVERRPSGATMLFSIPECGCVLWFLKPQLLKQILESCESSPLVVKEGPACRREAKGLADDVKSVCRDR